MSGTPERIWARAHEGVRDSGFWISNDEGVEFSVQEYIRADISAARIAAHGAQINGLEAELSAGSFYKEADIDALMNRAEAAETALAAVTKERDELQRQYEAREAYDEGYRDGLAASEARVAKLVDALTLAANRLSRRAVEYVPGSRLFIETGEWADEARAAITEASQ